jgi:formylmethanofuran dehydrogenase subunit E-like metal-binding protein
MEIIIQNINTHGSDIGEYIGRPSVLGNPFKIGPDGDRLTVVMKYALWLIDEVNKEGEVLEELVRLGEILEETGKLTLLCYCAPKLCHGDVLAHGISHSVGLHNEDIWDFIKTRLQLETEDEPA